MRLVGASTVEGLQRSPHAGVLLGEDGGGALEDHLLGDTPDTGEHPEAPTLETVRPTRASDGVRELATEPAEQIVGGGPPILQLVG